MNLSLPRRLPLIRGTVAVALVPLLLASLLLWSSGDRVDRLESVPAAVVNLDEPVRTGKEDQRRIVAAGRLLAAGLTSDAADESWSGGGTDESLDWRLTTGDDAQQGLRSGAYAAVITIPPDFSATVAAAATATKGRPRQAEARQAEVTVQTGDASSAVVDLVTDRVGEVAAADLGHRITATYLEGIYDRSGRLGRQLGAAGQGAGRLAEGAAALDAGSARLDDGAGALAAGLGELAGGAGALGGGAARVAAGAEELADGADRLHAGAGEAAAGAARLADGLGRLAGATADLPGRTARLADGADQVREGVAGYAELLRAWRQACSSDPLLAGAHPRLCAATVQAVGVDGKNAEALVDGARQVADGTRQLAQAAPELRAGTARAADGARQLAAGTRQLADGTARVTAGAEALAAGAGRLDVGAEQLAAGATEARAGADRLAGGTRELVAGSARLSSGTRDLAAGLAQGAAEVPRYAPGERAKLARVVAEPVTSRADDRGTELTGAQRLAPAVAALVLWLGAFATYLVRPALSVRVLQAAASPLRVTLAGWLPAAAVGVVQALLLHVGLLFLAAPASGGVAALAFLVAAAVLFAALNQALVALLGRRRGRLLGVLLVVVQAVSLDGLLPLDAAPGALQAAGSWLPVPLAEQGLAVLLHPGVAGSPWPPLLLLLLWAVAGLGAAVGAARRGQRLTLTDVRRRVAASRV